ncbi:hypothetical protein HYC85_003392 [Camellia sinensis]|uniref:Uncharacterized protein n=1 Tax=Camellia sinensis TaxID=4442 RepID=A0A7J7IB63_CAMSI|nr:hypothetical protein HYC85_003392 [Camellia sinensis]
MATTTTTLHTYKVHHARATTNKLHFLLHFTAVLSLLYYRISHLFKGGVPSLPWCLLTTAELIFTFLWFLSQAFRWGPLTRTAYPEKLSGNSELPGVDVFICTADPKKEPTVEVMNTVLSAMALDYPPEKLAVYLSDDGGSSLTLYAMKAAREFARCWIPFCRKYGIKSRCPDAYFSAFGDEERVLRSDEFRAEEEHIKSAYELFKKNVEKANGRDGIDDSVVNDRPPCVEVIIDNTEDGVKNNYQTKMPLLVYVSREKRPSHPHRFKAGALNALLRVSGIISNGPYVLVLDCDMYCNDPTSARQSMCFHLDPQMSRSLAFVQYPQVFHNVSKNDIYDGQARSAYMIGYSYDSLLESTFTGYLLHCKGWRSVYLYPKRPCFLGCATVDMKDASVQQMKWSSGLLQIALSRFSPITYGMSRMSILQSMCYGTFTFSPLYTIAFLLYGTIPQLCLLTGIPLYPKHLYEVLSSGGSVRTWWNEHRIWMIQSVTGILFGCLDVISKWLGITKVNFRLTNKAIDKEKLKKYEKGKFDFQGAEMFMVPLTILVLWNVVCFIGGVKMLVFERNFEEMFVQVFMSSMILVLGYPVLEGLVQRKGR